MSKTAIVVQRCHESIAGGAESLAWQYALLLKESCEVDVLTTTALDYVTWRNELREGVEKREGVTISRFKVDAERSDYWRELHRRLREDYGEFIKLKKNDNASAEPWSLALQEEFIQKQGPYSSSLLDYLRANHQRYSAVIFITYLYPTTYFGMMEVSPARSFLVPTLHNEVEARLGAYKFMAQRASRVLWLSEPERELGAQLWGELSGRVVGMAVETNLSAAYEAGYPYLLYCGRIDKEKGCGQLIDYFIELKKKDASDLRLILTGEDRLGLPAHPDIEYRGFVSEEEKLALMAGAAAFAMPSPFESLSIVTLEAMAQRAPVLVNSRSEVAAYHVEQSGGGFVYGDYDSFQSALKALLGDRSEARLVGERARSYVVSRYTREQVQQALLEEVTVCASAQSNSRTTGEPSASSAAQEAVTGDENDSQLDKYYWLLLGRELDGAGRFGFGALARRGAFAEIRRSLLSSEEFRRRLSEWLHRIDKADDPQLESRFKQMGSDSDFLALAYETFLERGPDDEAALLYLASMAKGASRAQILRGIILSQEFQDRYRLLSPAPGVIPQDHQLCELANPAKWDNAEWLDLLRSLGLPTAKEVMHRKHYEFAQTLFGLKRLNKLKSNSRVLSVGAGHEQILYWFANEVEYVVATDLYGGDWKTSPGGEGDDRVLTRPEDFAPFPYRKDHLLFIPMNGCHLGFADETFDVVYSLSSIEHFGGWSGARKAVEEMERVLKPGGVIALATEWLVAGPPAPEVFQPDEIKDLIASKRLLLVEPVDDRVWQRYTCEAIDLAGNIYKTPHMLIRTGQTIFTSVMLFLEKR